MPGAESLALNKTFLLSLLSLDNFEQITGVIPDPNGDK